MDDTSMMVRHRQPSTSQRLERSLEYSTSNQFSRNPYGYELVSSSTGATRSHCPAEDGLGVSPVCFSPSDQFPSTFALGLQDASVPNPQPEYVNTMLGLPRRKRRGSKMKTFEPELGHEIKDRTAEHLADTLVSAGVSETINHDYFVCNYCTMPFWVERDARNHVLMVHLYKLNILERYRCRAVGCLFTSNVKSSATRHCAEQGKPKWLCPICGKRYLRKAYKHKCKDTNGAGRAAAFDHTVVQPQYGAQTFSESNCEQVCEGKDRSGSYLCEMYRRKCKGTNVPELVPVIEQRVQQTVTAAELENPFAFETFVGDNLHGALAHALDTVWA